ncbi:MAG: phosphoglucosamine mutase [Anaerolineae bacterium]|nr:phosphoglucosamine mutase [Anaerolineae bacterium]
MTKIEFGTDGVRGKAGTWPIDAAGAAQIGYGVGAFLRQQTAKPKVLVGRDTRQSGEEITASLARGLLLHDVQVADVGVITTAGVAYLTKHMKMDAGIVISASHNPWTENGIKVIGADGCKLSDAHEQALQQAVNQPIDPQNEGKAVGQMQSSPHLVADYIDHLVAPFEGTALSGLKIAIDCSNGAASHIAPECFQRLGCSPIVLHAEPNGTNINHQCGSEIAREGRGDLLETVMSRKLDLGAAFDGDADRVILVDENGHLVDGDYILYILAMHLKERGELAGNVVVTTTMANRGLDAALAAQDIRVIRTPVGDKYIVRELQNGGYKIGGEQSGHIIIYDDTHTTGDGIYSALFIAGILAAAEQPPLSRLALPLQKFPQVIVSARVSAKPALQSLPDFEREYQRISEQLGAEAVINTRYSGTEPLFRVMIEGTSEHRLSDIAKYAVMLGRTVQSATGNSSDWIEAKDCTTGTSLSIENIEDGGVR